ncbi:MAG: endonuclease/exonuclease/phosphatase family protein [Acidimicrobiia bacterium]|jgi:endonuclease/exonuclease/phosphatase family metal-dependent hydrolase
MRRAGSGWLLTALVFLFGLEMARFQFGSLGWYQRDTLGIGALDLIPIALVPLLAGIVLPVLSRWFSLRYTLTFGVVVLAAARSANQLIDDPAIDHWTSAVALAALVGLLPLLTSLGRDVMVTGVLAGITFDSALKGLGSTLDLPYRPGVLTLIATVALSAIAVYLSVTIPPPTRTGPRWGPALTLIGIGPYLFIQYQLLQSPGWISEVSSLTTGIVAVAITALNVAALWTARRSEGSPYLLALAGMVIAAAAVMAEGPRPVFTLLVLLAIPAAGIVWAGLVPETPGASVAPAATALTLGMVLFVTLGFSYYLPLDLDLGFSQAQVRIVAGLLVLGFAIGSALIRHRVVEVVPRGVPGLVGLSVVLPLLGLLGGGALPEPSDTVPVRYMSYNLHQSFGTGGEMDVSEIESVIESSGAAVVGLQEVARGGLLNANTDLVHLLGERLGWEHVAFFGTTDPVWGNAILSRYPLGDVERRLLPKVGTPYQRGYLAAPVATPGGEVLFISTHLQHINDPEVHDDDPEADLYPVHHEQLGVVVEGWGGRRPAVLVGDLNARPGWRQIDELLETGWIDSWAESGSGDGYTSNAADPRYRIDYVFHTPDLTATNVEVIESQASDHFAVVADLTG